ARAHRAPAQAAHRRRFSGGARGAGVGRRPATMRVHLGGPEMPHAIRFHKTGGPEVLQWEDVPVGDPGPGEARVAHKAIGLNFIETYHRSGLYPLQMPSGLGNEAAGVVE